MSSAHPSCDFDLYTVEYVFEHVFFAATEVRCDGSTWFFSASSRQFKHVFWKHLRHVNTGSLFDKDY